MSLPSDAPLNIQREVRPNRVTYTLDTDGAVSVLTYAIERPDLVVADSTRVPVSMRGRGIAAMLVERLVEDARAEGFKISPKCKYVEVMRRRRKEWADVFVE